MTSGGPSASLREVTTYFRPPGLAGVEALHASFVTHAYRPHSHPTWTVAMMERGAASFALDDTDQEARDGELFVLEPESVAHGRPGRARRLGLQGALPRPGADRRVGRGGRGAAGRALGRVPRRGAARRAARRPRALAQEPPGLAVDEAVVAAVDRLRPHLRPGAGRARSAPEHAAVRRARRHLEERWAQPVTLAELAAHAGLSRFELARTFRAQVGLPPHAFQLDLRIARARALLAAGEPPAAVAAACGFCDQAHLTRVFKRAVGVTPARYARSSKTPAAA